MNVERTTRTAAWLLVLILAALALIGCGAGAGSGSADVPAVPANLAEVSLGGVDNKNHGIEPGQLAPDFVMKYGDGKKVKLSDLRGQPVLINFWATWCAPCKAEMPAIVNAYEAQKDGGLVVLGINAEETAQQASKFMQEYNMQFPVVLDSRGDLQQLYMVRGLPTSIFIDRDGKIAMRWAGLLNQELLEEYLTEITAGA